MLRSTGASHTCATRSFGSARFTQTGPDRRSTRQMSDETPPVSAIARGASFCAASRARRRNASTSSGSEPLNRPGARVAAIEQTVVQAVFPSLPEFDRGRRQSIAAPMRRPRRIRAVTRSHLLERALELRAVGDPLALRRRPRRVARTERPAREIGVRFARRHFLDIALDPDLALDRAPEEY